MFDLFDFDLPGAVTEQLEKRLQSMPSSRLTEQSLRDLAQFQKQHKLWQGVYQLLLKDEIVYVGKATDVGELLGAALLENEGPPENYNGRRAFPLLGVAWQLEHECKRGFVDRSL